MKIRLEAAEKFSNIQFHENPSSGSRVVPCGRTYMTKLTVTSINAPKKRRNGPMIKVGNGKGLFGGTELARDWRD